jgi:hypothetical protein
MYHPKKNFKTNDKGNLCDMNGKGQGRKCSHVKAEGNKKLDSQWLNGGPDVVLTTQEHHFGVNISCVQSS